MIKIIKKATITLLAFLMCFTSGHWMVFADDDHITITIMDGDQEYESSYIWTEDVYGFNLYYKGDNLYSEGFAESLEDAENGVINYCPTYGYEFDEDKTFYIVWKEGYTIQYSVDGNIDPNYTRTNANKYDYSPNVGVEQEGYRFFGWYIDEECTTYVRAEDFGIINTLYGKHKELYEVRYWYDSVNIYTDQLCNGDSLLSGDILINDGYSIPSGYGFVYWSESENGEEFNGEITRNLDLYVVLGEGYYVSYCNPYGELYGRVFIQNDEWNIDPETLPNYQAGDSGTFLGWSEEQGGYTLFEGPGYDDLVLYAVTRRSYNLRYYLDDGTLLTEDVYGEETLVNLDINSLNGYVPNANKQFSYWCDQYGNVYYIDDILYLNEDLDLYAVFEYFYSVTFHDFYGNEVIKSVNGWIDSGYDPSEVFENRNIQGYRFVCWTTDEGIDFSGYAYEDLELYAKYERVFEVKYYLDENTLLETRQLEEGAGRNCSIFELSNYSPLTDQAFLWWSDVPGGNEYEEAVSKDMNLYAVFGDGVNVKFYDGFGNMLGTICITPYQYYHIKPSYFSTYVDPQSGDYMWWTDTPGSKEQYSGEITEEFSLYAVYYYYYDVHFYDGDQLLGTAHVREDGYDDYYPTSFAEYSDDGRKFVWWSTSPDGEKFSGNLIEETDLYAVFGVGAVHYYDIYGNELGEIRIKNSNDWNVNPYIFASFWLEDNCEFVGWAADSPNNELFRGEAYDNLQLYAVIKRYYNVDYYDNKGFHLGTRRLESGSTVDYDITEFENYNPQQGEVFLYWSTEYDGEQFTGEVYDNMTVYAVCEIQYLVHYYEGKELKATRSVRPDAWNIDPLELDPNWEKEGYKFVGWSLNNSRYNPPGEINGETNLYARFEQKHIVIYYVNGTEVGRREDATEHDFDYAVDPSYVPANSRIVFWSLEGSEAQFNGQFKEVTALHAVIGKSNPTLVLDTNNGTGIQHEFTIHENYGVYSIINNKYYYPDREGYIFCGWSQKADSFEEIDNDYLLDDTTFYAYWIENGHTEIGLMFTNVDGYALDESLYSVEGLGDYLADEEVTISITFNDDHYYIQDIYVNGKDCSFSEEYPCISQTMTFTAKEGRNDIYVEIGKGNLDYKLIVGEDETTDYIIVRTDRLGRIDNISVPEKPGYFLLGWQDTDGLLIQNIEKVLSNYCQFDEEYRVFTAIWGEAGKVCPVNIEFYKEEIYPSGEKKETLIVPEGITVNATGTGLTGEWYDFDIVIDADTVCGLWLCCTDETGNITEHLITRDYTENGMYNSEIFTDQTIHYSVKILDEESLTVRVYVKNTLQLFIEYPIDSVRYIVSDERRLEYENTYEIGDTVTFDLSRLYKGYELDKNNPLIITSKDGAYSMDGELFLDGDVINPEVGHISDDGKTLSWKAGWGYMYVMPNIIYTGIDSQSEKDLEEVLSVNSNDDYDKPGIVIYNPTNRTEIYTINFGVESHDEYWNTYYEGIGDTWVYKKIVSLNNGTVTEEEPFLSSNLTELEISVDPSSYVSVSFDNLRSQSNYGSIDTFFYKVYNTTYWKQEANKGCISKNDTIKHLIVTNEHEDIICRWFEEPEVTVNLYSNQTLWVRRYPEMYEDILVNKVTYIYTSSDESVVKVDSENFMIYPIGIGTAEITFTSSDGFTDTCIVNVIDNPDNYIITLDVNGGDELISNHVSAYQYTEIRYFAPSVGTPTREGYVFGGWTLEKDTLPLIQGEKGYFDGDCTLYAYWIEEGQSLVMFITNDYDADNLVYEKTGDGLYNAGDEVTATFTITDDHNYLEQPDVQNIDGINYGIDGRDFHGGVFPATEFTVTFKTTPGTVIINVPVYNGVNTVTIMNDDDTVNTVLTTDRFGALYDSDFPEMTKDGYYLMGWKDSKYTNYMISMSGDHYTFNNNITLYPYWDKCGEPCNINVIFPVEDDNITIEGEGQYLSGEEVTIRVIIGDTHVAIFGAHCYFQNEEGNYVYIKGLESNRLEERMYHNETVEVSFIAPSIEEANIDFGAMNELNIIIDNPCPEILDVERITTAKAGEPVTIVFDTADGYELSKEAQFLKGMPSGGGGFLALNGDFLASGYYYKVNDEVVDTSVTNQLSWIAGAGDFGRWANIVYVGNNTEQEEALSDIVTVSNDEYNAPGLVFYNDSDEAVEYYVDLNKSVADDYRVDGGEGSTMSANSDLSLVRLSSKRLMNVLKSTASDSITEPVSGSDGIGNVTVLIKKGVHGESYDTDSLTVNNLSAISLILQPGEYVSYSINDEKGDSYYEYRYIVSKNGSELELGYVNDGDYSKHLVTGEESYVAVRNITLNKNETYLNIGESEQLIATLIPATATDKTVNWSSDHPEIVTVDQAGLIKAVGFGEALIMAKAGNLSTSCLVRVVRPSGTRMIILDPNGGVSGNISRVDISADDTLYRFDPGMEADPTREGYIFAGWTKQKNTFPLVSDYKETDPDVYVYETTTLYAYWIPEGKAIVRLTDRYFEMASDSFGTEYYEVTGTGTYDADTEVELTFKVLDDVNFIRACYITGTGGIYYMDYDLAKTELTAKITVKSGLINFEPFVEEGFKTLTITPEEGDVFVAQADRFNYLNVELPTYTKEGYYLKGFAASETDHLYTTASLKRLSEDLYLIPIWDVVGVDCKLNVITTSSDKENITVEGSGNYKSGDIVTIKVHFAEGKYRNIWGINALKPTNEWVFVKGVEEFNSQVDNAHFYNSNEILEIPITIPSVDEVNISIDVVDTLAVRFKNPCPEILKTPEEAVVNAGDEVVIRFETLPGYQLSQDEPLMQSNTGWSRGSYLSHGLYGRVLTGTRGERINKEIVDTTVINQLSWIAGVGEIEKWPNIIFVGYGTEREEELENLIQISEENENSAGLVVYNPTDEPKTYRVEFDKPTTDNTVYDSHSLDNNNMRLLSRAKGITALTRNDSGLELVTLLITKGNYETGTETSYTQEFDVLSDITITVQPGEYMSYSVVDENGDIYSEYQYAIIDTVTEQEVRTGYVNNDDPVKHLLVSNVINITSITLNKDVLNMNIEETEELVATVNPEGTTESKEVVWSSSDENVAAVNDNGVVTAVGGGEAVITAKASNGMTATCKVVVTVPATSVVLDKTSFNLKLNKTAQLTATILPENATDKSVIWTSSNESVATVDENGTVTGVSEGTATITVTTSNGISASCEVTVVEETTSPVVIQSSALVLEGVIQIQFKVIVPEAEEKNIVVKFEGGNASNSYEESYNAAEKRVKSEETAEGMVYYYRVPVYAKQMNDKVTIWFTDLEGNKVSFYRASGTDVTESGFEYSVATYINNKWDSSTTKTRNLVRAMKYYGLYAQKVFTYEVSLADEILSTLDPMSDVDISLLEPYAYVKEGTAPAGLKVASFSLTLEEDIRINYKLDVGEGVNPEDYDIRLDGKKVKAEKSGSEWYVYKANIAAKDLDTMHELSISDGTNTMVYRYGVLTYCYNKLSNSNTDTKTKNLCKSIYWYSKAADAYWGS